MTSAIDTYLGWEEPRHLGSCKRPTWSVDFRTDEKDFRPRHGGNGHQCTNEDCEHGDWMQKLTVRIVCSSCHVAVIIRGENAGVSEGQTGTAAYGYGLPPRRAGGLLLWPGEPYLNVGRLHSKEPYDLVATRLGVKKVTKENVVGIISQHRGSRGAVIWTAAALPAPDGKYGAGQLMRWTRVSTEDATLRSVPAAAKWIAAQLASADTAGGAS